MPSPDLLKKCRCNVTQSSVTIGLFNTPAFYGTGNGLSPTQGSGAKFRSTGNTKELVFRCFSCAFCELLHRGETLIDAVLRQGHTTAVRESAHPNTLFSEHHDHFDPKTNTYDDSVLFQYGASVSLFLGAQGGLRMR